MVTLHVDEAGSPLDGILRYVGGEHSFRFDVAEPEELLKRSGGEGVSSLSVGTLQIEVGVASSIALYVWGLSPRQRWQSGAVGFPEARTGTVIVSSSEGLRRGVSVEIAPVNAWPTVYDSTSGWIRVRQMSHSAYEDRVLIASGIALGLSEGQLRSIWLQPFVEA